jgi:hypothetical protein
MKPEISNKTIAEWVEKGFIKQGDHDPGVPSAIRSVRGFFRRSRDGANRKAYDVKWWGPYFILGQGSGIAHGSCSMEAVCLAQSMPMDDTHRPDIWGRSRSKTPRATRCGITKNVDVGASICAG